MRRAFADAQYWIAIANPNDPWHAAALGAMQSLGQVKLVTTEENLISRGGSRIREKASAITREILQADDSNVLVQSHDSFLDGLELYEDRPDKTYSLTDCISMARMREEGLREILTNDAHFKHAGFQVLME